VKRFFSILVTLIVAVIVLPPLWYLVFPMDPPPDLPPAGERVAVDTGVSVNVLDSGVGNPVVLVHGLPGSAYDWRALIPELTKRGHRAIAYGRVGYGHSDPRTNGRFSPSANAEELMALLDNMDLRDATVVGWSYGGVTAMVAAMTHPERLGRIVLVGTGGPDSADAKPPELPGFMRFLNSDPVMRWRQMVPSTGIALMKLSSEAAFSGQPQPDWWHTGLRANFARWETLDAYRSEMAGIGVGPDEDPDAFAPESIAVPTLILHGDDDRLAPVAIGRYLDGVIPDSELHEYPGGSHMIPITHADDIADRITRFARAN
jgi:pimeloyl-ACP methyl ester carboxylesterase